MYSATGWKGKMTSTVLTLPSEDISFMKTADAAVVLAYSRPAKAWRSARVVRRL